MAADLNTEISVPWGELRAIDHVLGAHLGCGMFTVSPILEVEQPPCRIRVALSYEHVMCQRSSRLGVRTSMLAYLLEGQTGSVTAGVKTRGTPCELPDRRPRPPGTVVK